MKNEVLITLNRAISSVIHYWRLDIADLARICYPKVEVYKISGTPFYALKNRERAGGFIYVSDLAQFLYCRRKFYIMYRIGTVTNRLPISKIRKKLIELTTRIGTDVTIHDEESLKKILVGIAVHRNVENLMKMLDQLSSTVKGHILDLKKRYLLYPEVEIVDIDYGIVGHADLVMVDAVKKRAIVYEVKSGLYRELPESYRAQVQVYGYLVEKNFSVKIEKLYVVHPRREEPNYINIEEIKYSEKTSEYVIKMLREARKTLLSNKMPPLPDTLSKCRKCCYRLFCMYGTE